MDEHVKMSTLLEEMTRLNRRQVLKLGGAALLLPSVMSLAAVLDACGGGTTSTGGGPDIPVGGTCPLTGGSAVLGTPMAKALQITADDINKAGGPLGRKINMIVADDQSDPAAAARETQKLISLNNVVAILGGNGSSVVLAQLPITTQAGVLDINQGGAPEITGPNFLGLTFRTQSTSYYYPMAHYAKEQGLTNISVMLLNTTFSQVVSGQFDAEWKKLGMAPVKTKVTYNANQPSYASDIQKALQTSPDLLIILGYAADTTIIVKEWYSTGKQNHVMGLDFAMNSGFVQGVGAAASGLLKVGPKPPVSSPGYLGFAARFKTQTGLTLSDYPNAGENHDQLNILALAIEAAKSTKGSDIAAKIRLIADPPGQEVYDFASGATLLRQGKKINYQGASGPCDFDDNHNVAGDFGVWTIDSQGTSQLTKTYTAAEIVS